MKRRILALLLALMLVLSVAACDSEKDKDKDDDKEQQSEKEPNKDSDNEPNDNETSGGEPNDDEPTAPVADSDEEACGKIAEDYITACFTPDGDLLLSLMPDDLVDAMAEGGGMTRDELSQSFEDEMNTLTLNDLNDSCDSWSVESEATGFERGGADDIASTQENYNEVGDGYSIEDVMTVTVIGHITVTVDGETESEDEEMEVPCVKINGKWYLDVSAI